MPSPFVEILYNQTSVCLDWFFSIQNAQFAQLVQKRFSDSGMMGRSFNQIQYGYHRKQYFVTLQNDKVVKYHIYDVCVRKGTARQIHDF